MSKTTRLILLFAIVKLLIPYLFIHPMYELHRDEYLYLSESDHLAWGYIEAPPLLSLLGYISSLLGKSIAVVRFWSAFFGALNIYLIGRLVQKLGGGMYACLLTCLGFLLSGYLRMNILFQPNFLELFFWTLNSYLVVRLIQTDCKKYLYLLGISFAFSILSKYSAAFYILSSIVAFLLTPLRKWFASKQLYYALLICSLIIAPNIIWQINHNFPVATHMKLLTEQQLSYLSRSQFFADQLIMTLPSFFIWVAGFICLVATKAGRKYFALIIIYTGIFTFLVVFKGKSYYTMGIYPPLYAFGGYYLEKLTKRVTLSNKIKRLVMPSIVVLLAIPMIPVALPFNTPEKMAPVYKALQLDHTGLLNWEDTVVHPIPQDFADMLGWRQLTQKVTNVYTRLPDSVKSSTIIFTDNYGEASAVNFFRDKKVLPEAFSDDATFLFWLPESIFSKHVLLVNFKPRPTDDWVFGHFKSVQLMDSMTQPYAREEGVKIYYYSNADDSLKYAAENAIRQEKASFNIR
ncbi:MAG TPA: glycosyltransferase family 39 protein [Panacibacter sp.]|nr:glycosyltransferase family 39 protein [Panacibacter sp.]HNP44251.1 glycosyltransferase family 39 protein [Panacibacter sp.]